MKASIKLIFWSTLILCLGLLTSCVSKESSARQRITKITSIEVPSNSIMVYHHEGDAFVGRRSQYTVFSFEEKPIEFLHDNSFKENKKDEFEERYDEAIGGHISVLMAKDTPNEYLADWDNEYLYLWVSSSNVFFIYFTEKQFLIVFIVAT